MGISTFPVTRLPPRVAGRKFHDSTAFIAARSSTRYPDDFLTVTEIGFPSADTRAVMITTP